MICSLCLINWYTIAGTDTGGISPATYDLGIHWTDNCTIWWWCYFYKRHLHWFWNLWRTLESTKVWWIYSKPLSSMGCRFLESSAFGKTMLDKLNILWVTWWYINAATWSVPLIPVFFTHTDTNGPIYTVYETHTKIKTQQNHKHYDFYIW